MKVYFVRHGESEANLNKCFSGQTDAKLTAAGRTQAEAIRPILENIPFDKVYSSDLSRAHDTQKIALPGYEAETTTLLREMDVGNLAGKSIVAFAAAHGGVSPTGKSGDYTLYGGENREMLQERVRRFMCQLEKQDYDNVAVFAHRGILMSVIRLVLDNMDIPNGAVLCDNCAVNVVEFDGKDWRILSLNYKKEF